MKIRTGFVSNSSCSSFCIYGTIIDQDPELLFKILGKKGEFDDDKYDLDDLMEELYDATEKAGLEYDSGGDGSEGIYIGCSWSSIKDNQTGKQFKEEVESKINKFFKINTDVDKIEFDTHAEAYANY